VGLGRQRLLHEFAEHGSPNCTIRFGEPSEVSAEDGDTFYSAWVHQLLHQTVEGLMLDLHKEGKGDYFRVLYSRLCEMMTNRDVSELLGIKLTTVENHFRAAKKRLATALEEQVRCHVERYAKLDQFDGEFLSEWGRMGDYLKQHGGLESAVEHAYRELPSATSVPERSSSFIATKMRLSNRSE
jgi:hypothetical protein